MATFKFTLTTEDGTTTFGADKVANWNTITPSLVLNDTYRGVFREYTNTFNFVKEPRRQIISALDKYGYDTDIYLTIQVGDDDSNKSSFRTLAYRLKAELHDIEILENEVAVNFVDSGFVNKIISREDVSVNLDATESIDGDTIEDLDKTLWDISLHDRRLVYKSAYKIPEDSYSVTDSMSEIGGSLYLKQYYFPLSLNYASDSNFKNVVPQFGASDGSDIATTAFYLQSDQDRTINLKIDISGTLKLTSGIDLSDMGYQYGLIIRKADENTNDQVYYQEVSANFFGGTGPDINNTPGEPYDFPFSINFDGVLEIEEGDSMQLFFEIVYYGTIFMIAIETEYDNLKLTGESVEYFPATSAKAMLPHELFTRILQIYTGQQKPFYSEFFGRKDLGYSIDGPGAYFAVMTGKMIRGFPWGSSDDEDNPTTVINTSFKEAFENFCKIANLGATIEDIGNERRLRIEPISYFRDVDNVIVDLGNLINEPSRTLDSDRLYTNVSVGYENQEYEELNGVYAFNGTFGFSIPYEGDGNELDLVCNWRADDLGIELARRLQYKDTPSEDYRSDDDIFIIDSYNYYGTLIPLIVNNYFESIEGTFEPDRAYNLRISPKRNLLRWQRELKASVFYKTNSYIKFIEGPSNPNLKTQLTGDDVVDEDADMLVGDLRNPEYLPEILMISEAPLTLEQWETLKNNKHGVVKFTHKGVNLYGFIKSIEFDVNRETANFELLRANL